MKKIKIILGEKEVKAELKDTETANKIYEILPINSDFSLWGDEIYFPINVKISLEKNASDVVTLGDIAYWPEGSCFCIFFGKTPASNDEIRAASPVNVFGKVSGKLDMFKNVKTNKIRIEAAQ